MLLNAEGSDCTAVINEFQYSMRDSIESRKTALEYIMQLAECVGTPNMEICD